MTTSVKHQSTLRYGRPILSSRRKEQDFSLMAEFDIAFAIA